MLNSLTSTTAGVEWNGVNMLHDEFGMSDISERTKPSTYGVVDMTYTATTATPR